MNRAINHLVLAIVDSFKKFKNKLAYYIAIFAMVFGSTFGTMNSANAATVNIADTKVITAADKDGSTGGVLLPDDDYTINGATGTFSTSTTQIDVNSLTSITSALSTLTISGSGGLITGVLTATKAMTIEIEDTSSLTISGASVSTEALKINLTDSAAFVSTGATTQTAILTAAADGDGVITFSGVTNMDALIGVTAKDIGTLNMSAGGSIDAAAFVKDINLSGGDTDFTAAIAADTVDMTGAATTAKIGSTFIGATTAGTSTITMGATGQKVILDGTADVVANITATTDGFGEVQIDTAAQTLGVIGTSTSLKVGLIDIDAAATIENNVFADATTIKTGTTTTIGGAVEDIIYTGTINGDTDASGGIGNLTINNSAAAANAITFTGAVGTTGEIDMITLTTEANFSSDVDSDGITIANDTEGKFAGNLTIGAEDLTLGNAGSIANFNGTTTQTLTGGAAAEEIDGTGIVNISNTSTGGVVFSTNATIDSATVQLKLAANARATTSIVSHVVKDVTTLAGSVLKLDDTIADTNTIFTTTNTLTKDSIHASSLIKMPSNFDSGETIKLFVDVKDADVALITADVNSALVDTGLVNYVATTTNDDDITVTATETSDAEAATTLSVTTNSAKALRQARTAMLTTAAGIDQLGNILSMENGITSASRKTFVEQAAPQNDTISGSAIATRAMTGTVQGIVSNRMASLRSGDAFVTGMSAGNGMSANSGFIQAFGSEAEQKNDTISGATVYGYDSQTSGVAIGFDGMTETGETIGLSASFSTTDVDGKGTGKSKNAIDSYTVSVYADKATEKGYIEGSLTYGINDNTASRIVNVDGLSRSYAGVYDSEQISLKVGGGIPNEVKDGTFVTPFASATGTLITTDSYTETSTTASDALRLKIAQDDINSLVGTIGVKAHMITDKGTPMISFAINNEFGDTTINSTNTYTGGGTAFNTSTDVEELSVTLGLGYSFGNDVTSLNIGYEANANEDDYLSHYGTVKIISKF